MGGAALTIHGGSGSDTINFAFTVYGTNTTRYATIFTDFVNNRLADGDTITAISPTSSAGALSDGARAPGTTGVPAIDVLVPPTINGGTATYDITNGTAANGAYVVDSVNGNNTINLVTGFDTVLVAPVGTNPTTIVNEDQSYRNKVIFVDGYNTFIGDTSANAAQGNYGGVNDTLVGGSGHDTIITGVGVAIGTGLSDGNFATGVTVNSGTGSDVIYLQDTTAYAAGTANYGKFNAHVWLDDGHSTVYANGGADAIVMTTEGQVVIGGTQSVPSGAYDVVVINPNSDGTVNGNDLVQGGTASMFVFDSSSNNTIQDGTVAGAGSMYVVLGGNISANISGGASEMAIFGSGGDTVSFSSGTGSSPVELVAGAGNETLDAAAANAGVAMYGTSDSTGSDLLVGGAGNDTLQAGTGSETLTGGGGANAFLLNSAVDQAGNIVITDFNSQDLLAFSGYNASDVANAIAGGTYNSGADNGAGGFVVTLASSDTTITFVGVQNAQQLDGHYTIL